MTFKTLISTTGAAVILLATSTVWAQSTAPAASGMPPAAPAAASPAPAEKPMSAKEMSAAFTKADANKDGKLDRIEAEKFPGLSARFEQVDADADKMISKSEVEKAMK